MGIIQSIHSKKHISYEKRVSKLGSDFKKKKFIKVRSSSTIDKRILEIKKIGIPLNGKNPDSISIKDLEKVCFIVINTYKRPNFHLGVGPMNDATIIASNYYQRGYKVYFLHNSTRSEFLSYLKLFLQYTQKVLSIFYAGRTTEIQYEKDILTGNNAENDNKNKLIKAMVFEQGYVMDLDIGNLLYNFKLSSLKVVFICDCCHGCPIWDFDSPFCKFLNLPEKIISISFDLSDDISDYDKLLMTNDGIFTIYLWKIINDNPNITPYELKEKIEPQLEKFGLLLVYHSTSIDLDSQPIFE